MGARPKDTTQLAPERAVKLFRNGRNQAVRIPVEFELPGDEAIIRKEGDRLIIEPARATPANLFEWLQTLEPLDEEFPEFDERAPPPRAFEL